MTVAVALTIFSVSVKIGCAQNLDPRLNDYDISGQVRFQTSEQAEARRRNLIESIWIEGLPRTRPEKIETLSTAEELAAVDQSLISKIDRYTMNVSGTQFYAISYVASPSAAAGPKSKLAIVQAGHMPEGKDHYLDAGLKQSVERLLKSGFVVAVLQMPLVGWNQDSTGILPNGNSFSIRKRGSAGHDELFSKVEESLRGQTMAFFLEPVVQVTNELLAKHPQNQGLLMIGLSGGGWTTHLSAALDPRIQISIPVAGALPLYARPFSRGSKGDSEQEYALIFAEEDTNQDGVLDRASGVCSWLEVFALGGISPSQKMARQQIQVLNFEDSCCFSGPVYQTYEAPLAKRVATIGHGTWELFVDRTHKDHLISDEVLDQVLMPAISRMNLLTTIQE